MSQTSKRGLGKGFSALLSEDFDKNIVLNSGEKIEKIIVDRLSPFPDQPRKNFDLKALEELSNSIKEHGIIQPIVATPSENKNEYFIIAGERRWRAAKLAKLDDVPVIVRNTKELERLEIALIENVQRVDLSPLEQAASIERLHQQFSMSHEQIAKRLGKASSTVTNTARLLNLPVKAKQALVDMKITEGHARSILALKTDPERQEYLLNSIIQYGWNVRQAERFVVSVKSGVKQAKEAHQRSEIENPATKKLSKRLGIPVQIRRSAKGGRLELGFKTDNELEAIIDKLSGLSSF